MSRTSLFASLRHALQLALWCEKQQVATAEAIERVAVACKNRRQFLQATASAAGTALGTVFFPRLVVGATPPRIIIVGAGMAGLTCAYRLQQAGVSAQVIEAGKRVGGRMFSLRDTFPDGQLVELGGEFVDTGHRALRRLVSRSGMVETPRL